MKVTPSAVPGIDLIAPGTEAFESELARILGPLTREPIAPAIPYSVVVANHSGRTIALLGIRFDMTGPRAKQYTVIHYADTLRNPEKADFVSGTSRFVCAEPGYTSLILRRGDQASTRGRTNLDNLRKMLSIRAAVDCIAWTDGRLEGPDTLGAQARLARQRESESNLITGVEALSEADLRGAANDSSDRPRSALARKLLEGLQTGGREEMLRRAEAHRLKIPVWR